MTAPVVLVSSLDNAPVPHVAAAERLAATARVHGWDARLTYSLAAVPERLHANGTTAKAAHELAAIAVRVARGRVRGWAIWHNEGGGWRFVYSFVDIDRYGLRALPARLAAPP